MSRRQTIQRRIRSISIVAVAFLGATITLPFLIALALLYDFAALAMGRHHFMAVRLTLMGWLYLCTEVVGIMALGGLWFGSAGGRIRSLFVGGTYAIQRWWAGVLYRAVRTLFSLQVEVVGSEVLAPGPIIVFMRHASIVDNLLPNALIAAPHRIKLRYVLKRELLLDPALDIAGSRLPNYFVDRQSADTGSELAAIRLLGSDLGVDEGVLIYPEGTRFTKERRIRALDRLQAVHPELHARATEMRSVLPPRLGGPLALLDARPPSDVVIAAHTGLDGFSHLRQILGGGLVGSTIRVQFRRFSHGDLPTDASERANWLYDRWAEVDSWIEQA